MTTKLELCFIDLMEKAENEISAELYGWDIIANPPPSTEQMMLALIWQRLEQIESGREDE